MRYILKPAATLFITAVIVIAVLSIIRYLTLEPIERQKQRTQAAAMKEVLPEAVDFNNIIDEKSGAITAVYEGYQNGVLTGFIFELSPKGYSGNIDLMVGISVPAETISGMRVLRHTETPGLGSLAVKENFYNLFKNRELVPLTVVRSSPGDNDIQAITSATITTRAITNAVNEAIEWYNANKRTENNEQITGNSEQVTMNNEQVTMNNEQITGNSEQVTMNNEQRIENNEQGTETDGEDMGL